MRNRPLQTAAKGLEMLFSRACKYGIRTVLYLASQEGGPVLVRDIAERLDIPFPFLAKVVQTLVRHGLLNSQKGRGGGVVLARPVSDLTLLNIVEAIDGLGPMTSCVLGLPECSDAAPCPLHTQWKDIRDRIVDMLGKQHLAGFVRELRDRM